MKVIYGLGNIARVKSTAIAIGIFDGVHRGHQALIQRMIKCAKAHHATATVITFFPHPVHVLRPGNKLPYLLSLSQRLALFESLGVKQTIVIDFDKPFAAISPQYFIEHYLNEKLNAKAILVGEDFRFGRNRQGDIFLFKELSAVCGYDFIALKAVTYQRSPISSTRLRGLITEGNLKLAKQLLGRPFFLAGKVIKGDARGRTLGFRTANIAYDADIVPPKGVYAVRLTVGQNTHDAVANLGVRPSFNLAHQGLHLEVHVINKQMSLYGKTVKVSFIKKIRDEKSFASIEMLKQQINRDIQQAKRILK